MARLEFGRQRLPPDAAVLPEMCGPPFAGRLIAVAQRGDAGHRHGLLHPGMRRTPAAEALSSRPECSDAVISDAHPPPGCPRGLPEVDHHGHHTTPAGRLSEAVIVTADAPRKDIAYVGRLRTR